MEIVLITDHWYRHMQNANQALLSLSVLWLLKWISFPSIKDDLKSIQHFCTPRAVAAARLSAPLMHGRGSAFHYYSLYMILYPVFGVVSIWITIWLMRTFHPDGFNPSVSSQESKRLHFSFITFSGFSSYPSFAMPAAIF